MVAISVSLGHKRTFCLTRPLPEWANFFQPEVSILKGLDKWKYIVAVVVSLQYNAFSFTASVGVHTGQPC